jgi:signal transduction histidine kinase/ligand-binding sensor domain-containing protein
MRASRPFRHLLLLSFALLATAAGGRAEQLPVRTYTTADGLARDGVNRIYQDSHGFIWFCTSEGLSRFDGYGFTNYGTNEGLPHRIINDLLEMPDGTYLVATQRGLSLFNPNGRPANAPAAEEPPEGSPAAPMFAGYTDDAGLAALNFEVIRRDSRGRVWCGTGRGLYRLEQTEGRPSLQPVELVTASTAEGSNVFSITEGRSGDLWVGSGTGLYHLRADGTGERFTTAQGLPSNGVLDVLIDRDGHIWVGTTGGLCRLFDEPDSGKASVVAHRYGVADGLPVGWARNLLQMSDGVLWAATTGGLCKFDPSAPRGQKVFRRWTVREGMSDDSMTALTEDRDGNLWVGTEHGGAMKITRNGFATYGEADGLSDVRITSVSENDAGRLSVIASNAQRPLNVFDGNRFVSAAIVLPAGMTHTWGWKQTIFQDREGDWWVPTNNGLFRYAPSADTGLPARKPERVYTTRDGLSSDIIFRLYEDGRGDVWISALTDERDARDGSPPFHYLQRWERATDTIHGYAEADNIPASAPTAFREDAHGQLWIGFYLGGVARYREGRFDFFDAADGLPKGFIRDLWIDHAGRLWVAASEGGVGRLDDTAAERPRFDALTTADGLSSSQATCLTEDEWGRIYIGTGRGLDRLDLATNRIRHYSKADGLADNFINVCTRDRAGALWFGTLRGLSRLVPVKDDEQTSPVPVLIGGLRIAGRPRHIPELGTAEVAGLELEPEQNQIQIDFGAVDFVAPESLSYQYKLEGADRDWGQPTRARTVNYASLSPGSYRFMVRAIGAGGALSLSPAAVSFRVLPPLWRRWWFISLLVLSFVLAACAVGGYRAQRLRERERAEAELRREKEERLAELERVRKRIATDLHDDIGSSLTQIAVLSEVARQGVGRVGGHASEQLAQISAVSNELVESMSDIVWAINPKKDRVSDLVQRMRRFASDVFTARDIRFRFSAPDAAREDVRLGATLRREVFLIFKESVNNAVKHSGAAVAEVDFRLEGDRLVLRVSDDGRGFDASGAGRSGEYERRSVGGAGGNGLYSLYKRARELGGEYEIRSAPGEGTTVTLRLPLDPRHDGGDASLPHPNGW